MRYLEVTCTNFNLVDFIESDGLQSDAVESASPVLKKLITLLVTMY